MTRRFRFGAVASLIVTLLTCALLRPAIGQVPPPPSQAKPVSLAFLYWAYLTHQSRLDIKASSEEVQGRDGIWLRNHLQKSLGFNDAEYAPIRVSSARLMAEVSALDARAAAIRSKGTSPANLEQLKALSAQRKAHIDAEMVFLKKNLSPEKIAELEDFLHRFFPQNLASRQSSPGQAGSGAVKP